MTIEEKKERCKKCIFSRINERDGWCWPCDSCAGAIVTLVEPVKDYYEEGDEKL